MQKKDLPTLLTATATKVTTAALATAALMGCAQGAHRGPLTAQPNVIFIMADDLGFGDITPYGQQWIQTPNLERLAAQGMRFSQCYAGCTVSAPSRASLMTGLHTGHTHVRGNKEVQPEGQLPMPAGTFTMGTLFQEAGYATGAFGKWGLGYPGSESAPNVAGFDEFYGYNCQRAAHSYYPDHLWHNEQRVEFPENVTPGRHTYSHDIIHSKGLEFIREHKDTPFFAYLSYTLPHAELNLPHDSLYTYYCELIPAAQDPAYTAGGYHDSPRPLASFAAMVSRLDAYVGEVLDLLDELGIADQTLVIFTSDNGPHREGGANPDFFQSSGPFRGIKRDLYEGGIRVPFIARMPGVIAPGSYSNEVITFWDMLPTFAQLCGYQAPLATDGLSFLPTLTGKGIQATHQYLYWEFHEMGGRQALRQGDWKLIRLNVGKPELSTLELYNLAEDLHEDHNLVTVFPEKVTELSALMDSVRTPSPIFCFGCPTLPDQD